MEREKVKLYGMAYGIRLPLCLVNIQRKRGYLLIDIPPCRDQEYSVFCIRLPRRILKKAKSPYLQIRHGGQCYDVILAREIQYLMPANGRKPVWAY